MNDFSRSPCGAVVGTIAYVNVEIGYALLARLGGLTIVTSLPVRTLCTTDAAASIALRFGTTKRPAAFFIPTAGSVLIRYETAMYAMPPFAPSSAVTMPVFLEA